MSRSVCILLAVVVLVGCGSPKPAAVQTVTEPVSVLPVLDSPSPAAPEERWTEVEAREHGDKERGQTLVAHYECARCHDGTGQPAPFFERQCKGCHERVVAGNLPFPKERLDGWRASLRHYVTTPDLAQAGQTLRASWIASFLREPTKVRPHMEEWMPRLGISGQDASDIAAYLTSGAAPLSGTEVKGDAEHGKELASSKGCFVCHELTGGARAEGAPSVPRLTPMELGNAIVRAPDLRLVRDRFRPDVLVKWIQHPSSVNKGALMPTLGLSEEEARDIAAYLLATKLEPLPPPAPPFERLPILERKVTYDEVESRVFKKSCIHCHSDPDPKGGDTGPGNAGGFGFAPRGVSLSSHAGVERGYRTKGGARQSLLATEPALDAWGGSRLVAALVARHEETSGRAKSEVRGMPLGLPGLAPEDIQLVETWVAEGAPQN
jgi:cytochrome c2